VTGVVVAPRQDASEPPVDADRRRFRRAASLGAALAAVVFLLVVLDGQSTLLRSGVGTGFYDAQAHSLLDGHWDVPAQEAGIEGLRVDGKTYLYFGPLPSLLRLPVAVVTDGLDGELTQLSMLLAVGVLLTFTVRLAWRLRPLVRGPAPVTRGECWAVGGTVFAIGAGSVLVFLAGHLSVYHEAELWGAAMTIAAFDLVLAFVIAPTNRALVLATALATLALLTRASVGAGPLAALGLLLLATTTGWTRRFAGLADDVDLRRFGPKLAIAVAIPLVFYAYVNYAKFGSLLSVPWDRQVYAQSGWQKQVVDSNGGSFFSLKYLPSTALQYLRPDAIRFDELVPWVRFPGRPNVIGRAFFAGREPTSSIPASMPAMAVLAIVGAVGIVRPPASGGRTLAAVRVPVLGALAGAFVTLTIGYIAQRYLADFLPLLILLALVGFHVLVRWAGARRARAWAAGAVLGVLALGSLWANAGLAVLYGHKVGFGIGPDRIAEFVDFQYRVHDTFPGGPSPRVQRGKLRPTHPRPNGTVFVLTSCEAAYYSTGRSWIALPITPRTDAVFCEGR
jgi:hypothetical protein